MSAKGLVDSIARTYTSGIAYYLKLYNCKDVTQKTSWSKGYWRVSRENLNPKQIRLSITKTF